MSTEWADWKAGVTRRATGLFDEWGLRPDGDRWTGTVAHGWPVRTAEGAAAVLKLGFPHPEAADEHLALRAWNGEGAVRLLRADPHRWALLLERAEPGDDLGALPTYDACTVIAGLYARLHRPALPQLDRLSGHATRWAGELARLRRSTDLPRRFVTQAAGLAAEFAADPATDGRLLHGDLHYGTVLAAGREPWLAIDPKPRSGDPAYEVAPVLWNRFDEVLAATDPRAEILDRFYAVVDGAGLDEERARSWVVVRALMNVTWALEDGLADLDDRVRAAVTIVKAVQR